jgi:hypothetical protein
MQYKRIHIWGAVSISVVLHMLVGGVYTMSVNHSHRLTVTQPASMSVRIQSLSPVVDVANQISVRTANRVRMPKRQTQQRLENHVVSGHEDPSSPDHLDRSDGAVSSAPQKVSEPASGFAAILEESTNQAIKHSRTIHSQQPAKPWETKASDSGRSSPLLVDGIQGRRTEKVRTWMGTYCIHVPNPATAYRGGSALQLADTSNCP